MPAQQHCELFLPVGHYSPGQIERSYVFYWVLTTRLVKPSPVIKLGLCHPRKKKRKIIECLSPNQSSDYVGLVFATRDSWKKESNLNSTASPDQTASRDYKTTGSDTVL